MSNAPLPEPGSLSQAEQLFAQYQLDLERGESPDFEALCRQNPKQATELRQLKSDWDRVRTFAQRAGLGSIERASLADELRSRFGSDVDPAVSLGGAAPGPDSGPSSELLKRLRAHAPANSRYRMLGEVGRGGMGAVLKIWDEDLRRTLAMKVVLGKEDGAKQGSTPSVDTRTLGRFLEEAQVTGQLDHPGIVPVHELGLGSDGRVYFTMRLVKGEDLRKIYEYVESGYEGWNPTRALGVLLKVCEAMSYAHDKGVVHRDLKPANVMVGKYGEVYVMDWGLARVLGQEDRHDVRLRPEAPTSVSVRTERRSERDETPDSPLVTMDGTVVGTPSYMPPEQARGDVEKLGPHSDVYAVGAMLYHLLTGQTPFVPKGVRASAHAVLMRLIEGPPRPLIELAPRVPAELVAICEKAMERDIARRYRDMPALAEDLRAYLERRVVKAYESGTWAETKKWVQRNKPLAASLAAAVVIAVTGIVWVSTKNAEIHATNKKLFARDRESRLRGMISELAYFDTLDDDVYTYARRQTRPASEWWLERAHELVNGVEDNVAQGKAWSPGLRDVEAAIANVRARALGQSPAAAVQDGEVHSRGQKAAAALARSAPAPLEREVGEQRSWRFAASTDEWWHTQLVQLEAGLQRLKKQVELAEQSVRGAEVERTWSDAIAAIAASEKYKGQKWPGGSRLTPQLGLVPIGPDPETGYWEFAHLATGQPARRGPDKKIVLESEMGLVLVLLPGGRVPVDASGDTIQEKSLTEVDLDPFFLSKYEMTQEQWDRIGGWRRAGRERTATLTPADDQSWDDCQVVLPRTGWLRLPSEAQWEYGCRAGTKTKWWPSNNEQDLHGVANIDFDTEDDELGAVQPIGVMRANAFGLHDVHGNMWELCLDVWVGSGFAGRAGDGLRDEQNVGVRVIRGGSYMWGGASSARSSYRYGGTTDDRSDDNGLRPARGITP